MVVFKAVENYSVCVCGFDSDVYILYVTFYTAHLETIELNGLFGISCDGLKLFPQH